MRTIREDLGPPTIVEVQIGPMPKNILDRAPQVKVKFSDGTSKTLFSFYPDEISFEEKELLGMTEGQAHQLRHNKDVDYLRERTQQDFSSPYFHEEEIDEEDKEDNLDDDRYTGMSPRKIMYIDEL